MEATNFGRNYLHEVRELLSRLSGGTFNQRSLHPDIVIPNGSPEYRKKTIGQNMFSHKISDKLRSLIQRFSKGCTKQDTSTHEPMRAF